MQKEPFLYCFLSSVRVPLGFLRNWAGMLVGMGLRNVVHAIVGPVKSQLSKYFSNVHHTIPEDNFFRFLKASASSGCI